MKFDLYKLWIDFKLSKISSKKKLDEISIDEVKTIVIYSNTAIGDTLFNTPTIRAIKTKFPDKKVIAVLNPINYKLFDNNVYIDEVILYNGKWKNFFTTLKKLKNYKIDLSIILHSNEPQATPLTVLSNSKYVLKIPNNRNKYSRFHNNKIESPYEDKHGIFDRLKTLKYLGIQDSINPKMDLFLKEDSIKEVDKYLKEKELDKSQDILIGFQIGASTVSRMWFEDKWVELAKRLLEENKKIKIILTGSPSEKELVNKVFSKIDDNRVFNFAGIFSLPSAAVLINNLDLLITPDTGPMHMAISLKTPTIGLFVVAELIKSHACYDKNIHLYIKKDKTCIPCIAKKCKFQKCMEQITVNEVLSLISSFNFNKTIKKK